MSQNPSKSISLACLTALWGLAATPQSLAACANAQTASAVHWDPVLRRQWLTTIDCSHPERPAQARLTVSSTPLPVATARLSAPLVIRAGDHIRLWSHQGNTRMELTGIAEESASVGDTVHVRLNPSTTNQNEPELQGVVRGPFEAELR